MIRQPERRTAVYNWPGIIQNLLFPPSCLLCGDQGHAHLDLCLSCHSALPWLGSACPRCGLPHGGDESQVCGACLRQPPPFDRMVSLFRYEEPVRHLIQSLKFGARLPHARLLGTLLAERLKETADWPEAIIPVPLHPSRYRERGFNQSLEIARWVSRFTRVPLAWHRAGRLRQTDAQSRLHADERKANIRKAFTVNGTLPYRHVAILDDVVTTGATAGELARTLRRAGASRVDVWTCVRALT